MINNEWSKKKVKKNLKNKRAIKNGGKLKLN